MFFILPKKILLFFIRFYQKTVSFDHGHLKFFKPYGQCKFYPTCSEYCYQAIFEFGVFKGMFLSLKRLMRCNPWSSGGYDPLKKN